jgi:hypothetical protein
VSKQSVLRRIAALEKSVYQPVATVQVDARDALIERLRAIRDAQEEVPRPPTAAQTRAIMRAFQERVAECRHGIDACEAEKQSPRQHLQRNGRR